MTTKTRLMAEPCLPRGNRVAQRTWVVATLLLALSACSSSKECRDGTLFVTIEIGAVASSAKSLEVRVATDGVPRSFSFEPMRALRATESVEIGLPSSAAFPSVTVVAVARSAAGDELARSAEGMGAVASGSCLALSLVLPGPTGGQGGQGGTSGQGGRTSQGGGGGQGATVGAGGVSGGGHPGGGGHAGGGIAGGGGTVGGRGGGVSATGGAGGRGGAPGSGGAAAGGAGGGGMCQGSETRCSGTSLQTCSGGQWGAAATCGAHRTCTGPSGTAKCSCITDSVCTAAGNTCSSPATSQVMCAQDTNGCFYQASSSMCTNGACSNGACCTNACTMGNMQCGEREIQSCQKQANGCTAWVATSCAVPLVCERHAGPVCADAQWAAWPVPNAPADNASPNKASYTDNGNGTVTDAVTGLMWRKVASSTKTSQPDANVACQQLVVGPHADWRLPTQIELLSLVDYGSFDPAINATFFPSTPSEGFWSATPLAGSTTDAWYVEFFTGNTGSHSMAQAHYSRCVR